MGTTTSKMEENLFTKKEGKLLFQIENWKVSKYVVFLVHTEWDSNRRKYGPEKAPYLKIFGAGNKVLNKSSHVQ